MVAGGVERVARAAVHDAPFVRADAFAPLGDPWVVGPAFGFESARSTIAQITDLADAVGTARSASGADTARRVAFDDGSLDEATDLLANAAVWVDDHLCAGRAFLGAERVNRFAADRFAGTRDAWNASIAVVTGPSGWFHLAPSLLTRRGPVVVDFLASNRPISLDTWQAAAALPGSRSRIVHVPRAFTGGGDPLGIRIDAETIRHLLAPGLKDVVARREAGATEEQLAGPAAQTPAVIADLVDRLPTTRARIWHHGDDGSQSTTAAVERYGDVASLPTRLRQEPV